MKNMKIGDICTLNPKINDDLPSESLISFIPMSSVSIDGKFMTTDTLISSKAKNYTLFQDGDVLFAKITPCMENGKGAIARGLLNGYGAGSTEFIVLRPNIELITAKWLYLYLSQRSFRWECQQHMTGSAGQKRVPPKYLASCEIPVPTISEQERIVSKIEELFSKLDACVVELHAAKEKLKIYRQAAITQAFPALSEENTVKLNDIASISGGITKGRKLDGNDSITLPYLRVANVQNGFLDLREVKSIQLKKSEMDKYLLKYDDVLYTEGGDRDKLGRGTVWRNEIEDCVHQNHVFKARLKLDCALPEYVAYWSMSTPARNYFYQKGKQSVNLASINKTVLSNLLLPLPSVTDQQKTIESISARISVADNIEQSLDVSLQQAEALRQSILKQAFDGELV